jgi:hypothetical protein
MANGAATECNAEGFCIAEEAIPGDGGPQLLAGDPINVEFRVANTSTPYDRAHWAHAALLSIAGEGGPPPFTPSSQLPNGLLLAGGGTCTKPAFTDCAGGFGEVTIYDSFSDSETTEPFGIEQIINMNPPEAGMLAEYKIRANRCPSGSCETIVQRLKLPADGTGQLALTLDNSFIFLGVPIETTIKSLHVKLAGTSSQLESGPAGATYTTIAVPRECRTYSGSSTYESRESGSVSFDEAPLTVTGCPMAVLAPPRVDGAAAQLDGSPSTASVPGRAVAAWHWDFGDGSTAETDTPTVSHAYPPGTEHLVTLYVEDSAGARSSPTTATVAIPPPEQPLPPTAASGTDSRLPDTRLAGFKVRGHRATFRFTGTGPVTGFQCSLQRRGKGGKPKFHGCRSPKTYRGLKPGRFVFTVRAVGASGPDASAARKAFRIH